MTVVPKDTLVVAGHTVALAYDDTTAEYAALQESCGAVRRDERARWIFAGEKAAAVLAGLLTNDIESLTTGNGCYAAALTPKGRVVADMRVLRRAEDFLVDVTSRASSGWNDVVRKYVNPRLAQFADVSAATGCIGLYGPRAPLVLGRACGRDAAELSAMAPYTHVETAIRHHTVRVIRSPDFGLVGFDIVAAAEHGDEIFEALQQGGARAVGLAAADIARVEAGRPEWGIDMDDSTIPQEANLEQLHAISYTKGCYTGQEVVARVHFRGHVNRTLRGLTSDQPMAPNATLVSTDRADVGSVRSSVVSPRFGAIALAMVRREVPTGDEVLIRDGDHVHAARVTALPF